MASLWEHIVQTGWLYPVDPYTRSDRINLPADWRRKLSKLEPRGSRRLEHLDEVDRPLTELSAADCCRDDSQSSSAGSTPLNCRPCCYRRLTDEWCKEVTELNGDVIGPQQVTGNKQRIVKCARRSHMLTSKAQKQQLLNINRCE